MKNEIKKIVDESKRIIRDKNELIKELRIELRKEKTERSIGLEVINFPEVQEVKMVNPVPEIQKVLIVNNDKPKVQDVRILSDGKIEVEKTSAWLPSLMLKAAEKISGVWIDLWAKGLEVKISEQEKPLRVIVVDIDGKPTNPAPVRGSTRSSPGFPMIMHGNVTEIAMNVVSYRLVISTPGTPVQLPNVSAKTVIFTSLAPNAGVICIGGKTVNATSGNESGSIIYPTGSATLKVASANALWVDGSNAGDVVIYNIMS